MRPIDATPLEKKLFPMADKALAKNPYERARVCAYRRAFEMVLNAPTITPSPNPPLTLEDLRKMDGEPVYFDCGPWHGEWAIVLVRPEAESEVFLRLKNGTLLSAQTVYARIVFRHRGNIYRRKPEEGR